MEQRIPLVILAAGASTRMGQAKQLLQADGELLLHRIIRIGQEAGFAPLVVVTGARQQAIAPHLDGLPVQQAYNPDWATGMGSSVSVGLMAALGLLPGAPAVGFVLTDQPYVSAALLRGMKARLLDTEAAGIAAAYQQTLGVPAIFRSALYPELRQLSGQKGAKPLLRKYADELIAYPFPQGHIDLDTPADWAAYRNRADE
ncbi:MAG: NTP transferase domain-containing protein [Bacteroidetes bacterium]|jgi:molybdenum cofactor cytidylyltransferase|nr:NTP transferase domain-containing protein [Bacteroidota bacterium]